MHTQSRNPYRERDHRISLMPMAREARFVRPAGELPLWAGALLLCALFVAVAFAAAAISPAASPQIEEAQPPAASMPSRDGETQ